MRITILIITLLFQQTLYSQGIKEFYVSANGNDNNEGSLELPFRTITKVRDTIRMLNQNMDNDIIVYLRGGVYNIDGPIQFSEEDNGMNGFMIHYTAYEDEKPVISGGIPVTGWEKFEGNIFVAPFESNKKLRQLYVNGQRCYMARGDKIGQIDGKPWGRITIDGTESWADGAGGGFDGTIFTNKANLPLYNNPELVELHSQSGFAYHIVELRDIITISDGNVARFQQPMGAIAANTPEAWGCGFYKNLYGPERLFHFENAMELLDKPGEFYFDVKNKRLYYYKRSAEDMTNAEVIAPLSEGLITMKGKSTTNHVANIRFEGITFSYDHWSLTEVAGSRGQTAVQSVSLQVRFYPGGNMHDNKYRHLRTQQATIDIENSDHIYFINNTFEHLGAMAINLGNDASDCVISCNVFQDLGSASINVGDARNVYIGDGDIETNKEGIPKNNLISNNHIIRCCREYLAAPAISAIWTENCQILNNTVKTTPYTGISLGWGWLNFAGYGQYPASTVAKNNKVNNNVLEQIDLYMHDGGAIYTLGSQPGSEIIGNHINGVVSPTSGNAIYLDQATSGITVNDNVCQNFNGKWLYIWGKDAQVRNITANNNYTDKLYGTEFNNALESTESGTYTSWETRTQNIVDQAGVDEGKCQKNTTFSNQTKKLIEVSSFIYPNPSDGKIMVQTDQSFYYQVLNMQGNLIQKGGGDKNIANIDLSNTPKGIYLIKMSFNNRKEEVRKLVLY